MMKKITSSLVGLFILAFLVLNTLFCAVQLFPLAFIKFVIPLPWWRKMTGIVLIRVANNWVWMNSVIIQLVFSIDWDIRGTENLKKDDWYLVISNHQTWVDIFVLQKTLYGNIPYIKFFLKKELIWVPILGLAWWALEFPFMKRYTPEEIKRKPHLKGVDMEITRKACEKFKTIPITIMTFVEGTRFTPEKHDKQGSPYRHLLKPKAGGVSFTLSAMGGKIHRLLNTTIIYPDGVHTMWEFMCGKTRKVIVVVEPMDIPEKFIGADIENESFRNEFTKWLNGIWKKKDDLIESMQKKIK